MEAGATYVAVGTALGNHGVSIFDTIASEWDQIQVSKKSVTIVSTEH